MPLVQTALIFVEAYVELPVEVVLHAPVAAAGGQESSGLMATVETADVIMVLRANLPLAVGADQITRAADPDSAVTLLFR
jgi:hypothetical protein